MSEIEQPIKACEARKLLCLGVSAFSAIKRAMGISGRKYVLLSEIKKWRRENPNFREQDIYHRPDCVCAECQVKKTNPNRRGRSNQKLVQGVGAVG